MISGVCRAWAAEQMQAVHWEQTLPGQRSAQVQGFPQARQTAQIRHPVRSRHSARIRQSEPWRHWERRAPEGQ